MKVKKLKGKTINGFTILKTHQVVSSSGKKHSKILLKCNRCGREFDRGSGVDFEHIKCKCMCKPKPKSKFKYIEFKGKTYTQAEFCRLHNISETTFGSRIAKGESPEDAVKDKVQKVCKCCGEQFEGRRNQEYCSRTCYKRAHKTRARRRKGIPERKLREFKKVKCPQCGKKFMQNRARLVFCSKKCAGDATGAKLHESALPGIIARQKQKELKQTRRILTRTLNKVLKARAKEERDKELTRNCVICGGKFVARMDSNICCSVKCSNRWQNRKKYKRLEKNGKADYSITLDALYMKDSGICRICSRPINFDCDPNSDFYPSIDHIKPIAKGGLHRWDNVQLACRICNSLKRDTF